MTRKSPSPATLRMFMKRLKDYEQDVAENVERHTLARQLKEATDAGIDLVQPLADPIRMPRANFAPEQQIIYDISHVHRHHSISPQHQDAAAIRALVNAPDDINVLPRVLRAMHGTEAEAIRKLRAMYIAARTGPIIGFRGPMHERMARMDEMRSLGREFDRRLEGAREAARRRVGHGGKRGTRKEKKRTRQTSRRKKRRTGKSNKGRTRRQR